MNESNLHGYQHHAIDHVMDNPFAGLFLKMGLGKTIITGTVLNRLLFEEMEVSKVLIIAPLRVAENTWSTEFAKWDHLKHIKISKVLGNVNQRLNALKKSSDVFIINRENVPWLVSHYQTAWPFDCVVIDELSSFKSAKAARFKALRMVRPYMKRVIGLTGTPSPNGLIDLWPQMYLLDQGQRLGKTITSYRERYFREAIKNGAVTYKYEIKADAKEEIYKKIGDICISMNAEDYLQLPKRNDIVVKVQLDIEQQKAYDDFEETQVLQFIDENKTITAANAAALTGKLLQFANGAIYDADKNWVEVHTAKMDALAELIEAAQDETILLAYGFKHDQDRIAKRFKARTLLNEKDINEWNTGKIPLMQAHPASAGHGLNLQHGGHIMVWFGQTWSLELYEQFVARLDRQGQSLPVMNYQIICANTIDEDVYHARNRKADGQDALMLAVKARINKYIKLIA